jgi:hypothetical protein
VSRGVIWRLSVRDISRSRSLPIVYGGILSDPLSLELRVSPLQAFEVLLLFTIRLVYLVIDWRRLTIFGIHLYIVAQAAAEDGR